MTTSDNRRWATLAIVCLAQLMIVLDVTIVNVALPAIQQDLHFSQSCLTWVVNAFLVTFGSLLLLAGRIGDLVGRKRVFLAGLVTFTLASLLCGLAPSGEALVEATTHGWLSFHVLGFAGVAAVLMAAFLALESRIENPIMPLRILRLRGLINASLVRGLLVTAMYSTFFLGTLYLEQVRHYGALQTGAAFLPWTITVAFLSQGITARLVARFGPLPVLTTGMATAALGLVLFATVGPD